VCKGGLLMESKKAENKLKEANWRHKEDQEAGILNLRQAHFYP